MTLQILGFSLFSLLLLAIDFYIYKAIYNTPNLMGIKNRKRFKITWWTYSLITIVLTIFVNRSIDTNEVIRTFIIANLFVAIACKVFFLTFVLIDDIRRFIIRLKQKAIPTEAEDDQQGSSPDTISRSEFLLKAGILFTSVPFVTLTKGIISGAYDYQIKHRTLYLPNLPKAFDGIKLGQISDIHSGSFFNRRAVLGGVEMFMNEKPDFIFFTGDLVNDFASEMQDYLEIFSKVNAPLGVYSILGNHDYGDYDWKHKDPAVKAKNFQDIKATHKNMGWDLLLNENRRLKVDNEEIAILGVENWGQNSVRHGKMDLAVKNTDDAPVHLLLSHDPSHWRAEILPKYPQIDVMFSGHTHGMQFGVMTDNFQWSPIQYQYSEWAGLYQEKQQQLYVNVGFGFLEFPGRVGVLPEITIFELRRNPKQTI